MRRTLIDQAEEIFADALRRPARDRSEFVAGACADNDDLRRLVVELLEAEEQADGIIPFPKTEPVAEGEHVGRYQIERRISAGGMGVVYEAIQDHPHRTVALKVLRKGLASNDALRRFRFESQILGRLKHPNIAQIHDAGTFDEGEGAQPYFAMEYIEGQPLNNFADSHELDTRERLALFAKVCDAVQHAHLHGVIHRDLKPGNVLVDESGEPKVLDFGVARATDSDIQTTTLRTDIGQLIGTVPYMSPEQLSGDPSNLDTRSDVYSLGVVLYEMLAGCLPHDLANRTIPEAVQIIREEDPARLSSVARSLRGDLETIVAKALEKDKARRYQSAAELASDIRRHLRDEPIAARPASVVYRVGKFTKRNKVFVGGVAASFLILAAGTVTTTLQWWRARDEAARASSISEFLMSTFAGISPAEELDALSISGSHLRVHTVEELVDKAAEELEVSLADLPEVRAKMHFRLGRTYWGLGRYWKMQEQLERAHMLYEQTLGEAHPDTLFVLAWVGFAIQQTGGHPDEYMPPQRRAAAGLERAVGRSDPRTLVVSKWLVESQLDERRTPEGERRLFEISKLAMQTLGPKSRITLEAQWTYGQLLHMLGRSGEAEKVLREAHAVSRSEYGEDDLLTVAIACRLGMALRDQSEDEEAYEWLKSAWEASRTHIDNNGFMTAINFTFCARSLDRHAEAEAVLREKLGVSLQQLGETHRYTSWTRQQLGLHLRLLERYDEAERVLDAVRRRFEQFDRSEQQLAALALRELAHVLGDQGAHEEAAELYEKAVEVLREKRTRHDLAWKTMMNLAESRETLREWDRAAQAWSEAIDLLEAILDDHPEDRRRPWNLRYALDRLAAVERTRGNAEACQAAARQSLAIGMSVVRADDATAHQLEVMAWQLLTCEPTHLRDPETALELSTRSNELTSYDNPLYLDTLALAYHRTGDTGKAVEMEERAIELLPNNAAAREFEEDMKERLRDFKESLRDGERK